MKVSEAQYELFRKGMADIREKFEFLDYKIGDAPMTRRFMRSINNLCSDMMQMYYEEIKDEKDKALDYEIARRFKEKRNG